MHNTLCSDLFLYNFEKCQNLPYKINLPGYEFALVHVHPHTLKLSFVDFQTLKDQGYQKFTQKFEDFDVAKPSKMSVFEPKKPTVVRIKTNDFNDFSYHT